MKKRFIGFLTAMALIGQSSACLPSAMLEGFADGSCSGEHSFGNWTVCSSGASREQRVCSVCSETQYRVVSASDSSDDTVVLYFTPDKTVACPGDTVTFTVSLEVTNSLGVSGMSVYPDIPEELSFVSDHTSPNKGFTPLPGLTDDLMLDFDPNVPGTDDEGSALCWLSAASDISNTASTPISETDLVQFSCTIADDAEGEYYVGALVSADSFCTKVYTGLANRFKGIVPVIKSGVVNVVDHIHSYEAEVTEPTCTEGGYTTHTCSVCGDTYTDSETEALGHDLPEEWDIIDKPSCTEPGKKQKKCSRCDYTETETIEPTGHSYETVVTEPTCTEGGYTTHTCSVCGDTYTDSETEALGHDMSETVVKPTASTKGYTLHKCSRCEYSYKDSYVDELTVSYPVELKAKDASFREREVTVSITGNDQEEAVTAEDGQFVFPKLPDGDYTLVLSAEGFVTRTYHITVEGCEITEVPVFELHLPGDIDGANGLNLTDITLMKKHLKKTSVLSGYALECADINGDKKYNLQDITDMKAQLKGTKNFWK
ncbi:MAG: DUF2012 domain-containing protein [Ruminococcus sp.]|nr:DUF2012 domain-containing protein [Ruminococcus sp.]